MKCTLLAVFCLALVSQGLTAPPQPPPPPPSFGPGSGSGSFGNAFSAMFPGGAQPQNNWQSPPFQGGFSQGAGGSFPPGAGGSFPQGGGGQFSQGGGGQFPPGPSSTVQSPSASTSGIRNTPIFTRVMSAISEIPDSQLGMLLNFIPSLKGILNNPNSPVLQMLKSFMPQLQMGGGSNTPPQSSVGGPVGSRPSSSQWPEQWSMSPQWNGGPSTSFGQAPRIPANA